MAAGDWKELFAASANGDLELVKYHIKMGVDINYQHPEFMCTPLIESIQYQHYDIVQHLLENGADPTIKEDFGSNTPLSMAYSTKNKKLITLVEQYLSKKLPTTNSIDMKKILITGGNRGIGKAIALELLTQNYEVVITARNATDGKIVIEELKTSSGNTKIHLIQGDLSTIQQCRDLVDKIKEHHPDINVLINNAGVWMTEKRLNKNGLEMSFMVNYLAPYILTKGLTPILKTNQPARIVNVNAGLYVKGKWDKDKTPYGKDFHSIKTYANSKLCNTMFTIDYAKELEDTAITINAVHPGVINTGLGDSPKLLSRLVKIIKRFWKKPAYGAIAPVWLATSADTEGINGNYYNEKEILPYSDDAKNENLRAQLKAITDNLLSNNNL